MEAQSKTNSNVSNEQANHSQKQNETVLNPHIEQQKNSKPNILQTQNINIQQNQQADKQNYQKNKKINKHKKKKEEEIIYKNLTPFKQQEKHYKFYQDRQTDFSQLFDLKQAQCSEIDGYTVYNLPTPQEGAYIIKGFNTPQVVNRIGYLALNEFWKRPYRTNLNSRNELYDEKEGQKKQEQEKKGENVLDKEVTSEEFEKQINQKGYCFNDKIRWANVGHQYDWTLRRYPQYHTPMHPDIKQLTDRANIIFNKLTQQQRQYHPESAIVNYYGVKDYMTGHLDDAEYDQVSPIYSFSFGLSCVFLMGGMLKDVKPLAVRLDSGDLMIMAKNSRKCYHGVPRVISGSYLGEEHKVEEKLQIPNTFNKPSQVETYFQKHRININIRQVFPEHDQ